MLPVKVEFKRGLWSVIMKEVVSLATFDNRYIFSAHAGGIRSKSQIVRKLIRIVSTAALIG